MLVFVLAASLSLAQIADVETLTTDGGHYDKYASIAFDRQGTKWIAYTSMHDDHDSVVVRAKRDGKWSAEERIDRGEGVEANPKLAVDGKGALWVVWQGRRKDAWSIYARRRNGAAWGAEARVSRVSDHAMHPAVVVDKSGRLWAAWEVTRRGGYRIDVSSFNGSRWSMPAKIESKGSDRRPALAAAPDGSVWIGWDSTRDGNYDVFIASMRESSIGAPIAVTRDATIDDSPSLACDKNGSLWIAWNGMRGHKNDPIRTDRHGGDAFVRVYRNGQLLAPPGVTGNALTGQVSYGAVVKTPRDAVPPYWHWKQTQNYPVVFLDAQERAWVIWRTDATGAHNFDLWARVFVEHGRSAELHLTDFSPGRDEFPALANAPDGSLHIAWEAQEIPGPGELAKFGGGDVDLYNTLGVHNVVVTGILTAPDGGWGFGEVGPVAPDVFRAEEVNEPMFPGPAPGTAKTMDGRYQILFGDPHSHSILSDAKTGLPDQLLVLSRDHLGLDFAVVSDHAEMGKLQASEFAEIQQTAETFSEPGRFISLSGWEWTAGPAFGHRVILFRGKAARALSSAAPEGDTIEKLYAHVRGHDAVMSPHHTGHATWGRWNPGATYDEVLEPNFEIASWHGRNEFYANIFEGRRQVPGHQYQDALRLGRHVGAMAASDTHHLTPGEGGVTAVLAERLDRESIFDAIRNRRNYATTGARIVLEFTANGSAMGSRITSSGPIEMKVRVEGTAAIDRVEIVRNLIDSYAAIRIEQNPAGPDGVYMIYDPADPQGGARLPSADTSRLTFIARDANLTAGETSYYVRVTQIDGQQAWSSPIWVTRIAQ